MLMPIVLAVTDASHDFVLFVEVPSFITTKTLEFALLLEANMSVA